MAALFLRQNIPTGDQTTSNPNSDIIGEDDDGDVPFWWTRTGQIVRWSVFLGIVVLFVSYMVIGYWHAQRRMKKGKAPLRYHRWLLNRRQRARFDHRFQNPDVYYNSYAEGNSYGMHPMPPPIYDPNAAMPPTYQPPEGGSKVDPSQFRSETTRGAAPGEPSPYYTGPAAAV